MSQETQQGGKFQDFVTGKGFDDYGEFLEHLSKQSGRTHSGSVGCNNCGKVVQFTHVVAKINPKNHGLATVYCDGCKKELLDELRGGGRE